MKGFPAAARESLQDSQLRRNLGKATQTIRAKRLRTIQELPDWEQLREAGAAIKARAMATLPEQLERLEERVTAAGGTVHWARDGAEANAIVAGIARGHGASEVIKVKSLATDEIGLNEALEAHGVTAIETDLAELIVQLGDDEQEIWLAERDEKQRTLRLTLDDRRSFAEPLRAEPCEVRYDDSDADALAIEGDLRGRRVVARMRRVRPTFRLERPTGHLLDDGTFQR